MSIPSRGLALLFASALLGCGEGVGGEKTTGGPTGGTEAGTSSGGESTSGDGATGGGGTGGGGTGGATEGQTGTTGETETTGVTTSGSGETGGATTGGSEIEMDCAAGVAASEQIEEHLCGCEVEAGIYPDLASCLASQPVDLDPACRCGVYSKHPEDGALVACLSHAVTEYLDCMVPAMCAEKPLDTCVQAYFKALESCGSFSNETLADVEIVCNQQEGHKCGSGEVIPESWLCDDVADCVDMSDEAGCFFKCEISGEILPLNYKCDGDEDCADGTDEKVCP